MRTTLTLDSDVAERLRREQRASGLPFKVVVNTTIRRGLALAERAVPLDRFTVEARPLGVYKGLDYDNVGELLEVAESAPEST